MRAAPGGVGWAAPASRLGVGGGGGRWRLKHDTRSFPAHARGGCFWSVGDSPPLSSGAWASHICASGIPRDHIADRISCQKGKESEIAQMEVLRGQTGKYCTSLWLGLRHMANYKGGWEMSSTCVPRVILKLELHSEHLCYPWTYILKMHV